MEEERPRGFTINYEHMEIESFPQHLSVHVDFMESMAFDRDRIATLLDPLITHPDVEASILYSRGGVPVVIMPPNYENAFLFKQLGFVIRSEWSLRDIYTDPEQWRTISRQLDSYIVLLAQLSRMFLLGIILTNLDTDMEEFLLNSVETVREALLE